ncbi:MAG: pyridoxal phosphate-dependent aminotransferase [Oscillospiraceae bacterium]|nr:pyridoxal phosphate-dependent aminotransferase [Oscillospiraceae bacterium]
MEPFDFDTEYDRRIPGDIKYAPAEGLRDVIPMWIADMDFKAPAPVREALSRAVEHGIFGYTETDEEYDTAVSSWYSVHMGWDFDTDSILKMPGVMFAIAAAIRAFTQPGDGVLICQPVYYPFAGIVKENGRSLEISELLLSNGRYEFCWDDMERKLSRSETKLLLLCSPHNPVGRVWTREELSKLGELCLKHGVKIVSDEIHSDFVYPGSRHIPIASISEELSDICVTCTSPTKTFNLPGLQDANIIIANPEMRRLVKKAGLATGYSLINTMAAAATKAAYQKGEEWLGALLAYLQVNIGLVEDFCGGTGGKISLVRPEGTYLLWLDCRGWGLKDAELYDLFLHKAGVRLHSGPVFGAGGEGFMRMNIACPKSVLIRALEKIGTLI